MQHPNALVLLSGWAGSGKDTVGELLVREHGFQRLAFADALKLAVHRAHGIPLELMATQEGKASVWQQDGSRTVRQVLIDHGMRERAKDPDVWARQVLQQVLDAPPGSRFVVTDWRLPGEHRLLQSAGIMATTVRVQRFGRPPLDDPTETALDAFPFDHTIDNRGTLEQLAGELQRTGLTVACTLPQKIGA